VVLQLPEATWARDTELSIETDYQTLRSAYTMRVIDSTVKQSNRNGHGEAPPILTSYHQERV
jgi:hypothetical protein